METHLFWGQRVKGQGVSLQTKLNITAAVYVSHAGFSLLYVMPRRTSNASDTGFSCVTSRVRLPLDAGFSPARVFALL